MLANPETGEGTWAPQSGKAVIGHGFDRYPRVFGGWGGVIYAVDDFGNLSWYRYTAVDGSRGDAAWVGGGAGMPIGHTWQPYIWLWADPQGVIFGAKQGGDLVWWRYLAGDGSCGPGAWANGGAGKVIGVGWGDGAHKELFSNGQGTIYAVAVDNTAVPGDDDKLLWFRLLNAEHVHQDTGPRWANGGVPVQVGTGFTVERSAAPQGYPVTLSARPGDGLSFAISTTFKSVSASVIRLAPAADDPVTVQAPRAIAGRLQLLRDGYRSNGCGWAAELPLQVPADWKSGIYAVRLAGPRGLSHHMAFVVRPKNPTAPVAFLLPTNTYNAYNFWGGHNQYSNGEDYGRRTVTFLRPGTASEVEPTGTISHLLYSDLFLLRWMSANGFAFDCYHDGDLHDGGRSATWLRRRNYKALVLASHPEYWSDVMRQHLVNYLEEGGRLIYTGGNGIYERVEVTGDGTALVFRQADGARDVYRDLGKSEAEVLGVEFGGDYMTFAAYQVVRDHPLLEGTGLAVKDLFGEVAHNVAASGWEVDQMPPDSLHGTVLAMGMNPGRGADMTFVERANGGWVFSAGSISFNGALQRDTVRPRIALRTHFAGRPSRERGQQYDNAVSAILRNVFQKALL